MIGWPPWIQNIALFRSPEDHGVGDTLARMVGPVGGRIFRDWWKRHGGFGCGCLQRQARLNRKYPYNTTTPP